MQAGLENNQTVYISFFQLISFLSSLDFFNPFFLNNQFRLVLINLIWTFILSVYIPFCFSDIQTGFIGEWKVAMYVRPFFSILLCKKIIEVKICKKLVVLNFLYIFYHRPLKMVNSFDVWITVHVIVYFYKNEK